MSLVKKIKLNHFEGGKNLSQGGEQDKDQHLGKLVQDLEAEGQVLGLVSDAGSGGGATEAMDVPGLLATDQVLAVSQRTPGGNSLPLLGWSTQADDLLTGIWSANPGAGAVIDVAVKRVPLS